MPSCPAPVPAIKSRPEQKELPKTESEWVVILHDDDLHTYQYVVLMLMALFGMTVEEAFAHACEVDADGTTVVACLPKSDALLKRDQIMSFGGDPLIPSQVSMKASAEPLTG